MQILKLRPDYAGKIWKRSFISAVEPTANINPSQKWSFLKVLLLLKGLDSKIFRFSAMSFHLHFHLLPHLLKLSSFMQKIQKKPHLLSI